MFSLELQYDKEIQKNISKNINSNIFFKTVIWHKN